MITSIKLSPEALASLSDEIVAEVRPLAKLDWAPLKMRKEITLDGCILRGLHTVRFTLNGPASLTRFEWRYLGHGCTGLILGPAGTYPAGTTIELSGIEITATGIDI